jgi:hypothetical protein
MTEAQAEEIVKITKKIRQAELDIMSTKRDLREYYYKTIITFGSIVIGCTSVLGMVIAIFH